MSLDKDFWEKKNILITGHTGFKGAWMCRVLQLLGAKVTGFALVAPTVPSLFELCNIADGMKSVTGDIRDLALLQKVFDDAQPEIVIHMAAQPLVRESYKKPVYTYDVNVMGTVNVLECVRKTDSVKSVVNVTTDKVYLNKEWEWGYRENEELNGYDPYSNSKSCSELVTSSYKNSFFGGESGIMSNGREIAVSTCRSGNVIGGGDFSEDRIIPDCIRAAMDGRDIIVRNPFSTRPYQHVLEPVFAYLLIAQEQYKDISKAGSYNIGPEDSDCWTTGRLVTQFCNEWKRQTGKEISWVNQYDGGPHEANFLKLDCAKIKNTFAWKPVWNLTLAIEKIVTWSLSYYCNDVVGKAMDKQINQYCCLKGE